MSANRQAGSHKFVSAVILAAGTSTRLGGLKQLTKLGSLALLERVLRTVRHSNADELIVVLGYEATTIRRSLDLTDAKVVVNRRFRDGMSSSLKSGLAAVSHKAKGVLIVLADQPFLSAALIDSLIDVFQRSDCLAVAPTYRGIQGNPVLLSRRLFPEVASLSGDVGAKAVLKRHGDQVAEYPLHRPEVLTDIDTEKDLLRARRLLHVRARQSRKRPSTYENPGRR